MGWYLPIKARGHIHAASAEGVPYEFSGELIFESGCSATFYCSFLTHETQLAVINGEKASIELKDFVLPLPGRYLSFDVNHMSYRHEGLDQVVYHYTDRMNVPEAVRAFPPPTHVLCTTRPPSNHLLSIHLPPRPNSILSTHPPTHLTTKTGLWAPKLPRKQHDPTPLGAGEGRGRGDHQVWGMEFKDSDGAGRGAGKREKGWWVGGDGRRDVDGGRISNAFLSVGEEKERREREM